MKVSGTIVLELTISEVTALRFLLGEMPGDLPKKLGMTDEQVGELSKMYSGLHPTIEDQRDN